MTTPDRSNTSTRRHFLKQSGSLALGVSALSSVPAHGVFAADDQTIRLALIGCGGRGTGAVRDALSVRGQGPVQLYAMADTVESRMESALSTLRDRFPDQVRVTADRKFIGFDAYKRAIDSLRPGDVALCTTRAYIRPLHVEYAVQKGINVFMEKPFGPDPVGLRRLLGAAEVADKNNVKIAAGLQCRHSPARQALIEKIRNGEMGEIPLIRANRLGGSRDLKDQGEKSNDLMSQLQFGRIHLLWVGSGHMVDNLIHQIDECCWIKDSWPISCHGMGGRNAGSKDLGQNIDAYSMEFTFADGTKAMCGFRRLTGGYSEFATFVHGTKCAAQFSGKTHAATVHMFRDQRIGREHIQWTPTPDAHSPWQYEWNVLIERIRNDQKHNEAKRAVYSDMASLMGRAACHLGRIVTWEEVLQSDFEWCSYLDRLDYQSPAPVRADSKGQFPFPMSNEWKEL